METRNYWEENGQTVKYDNYNANDEFGPANAELNFAVQSEDEVDVEYPAGGYLKKGKQDPMSHRIIEKRRRDRMNNCLADLSRLIPPEYLKKGRGRVEKTEIIEMAIRHLKFLQERANVAERLSEGFRGGYQEAAAEAVRFLVEVQGYGPCDGLCVQMAAHLHRQGELVKAEATHHEKVRSHQGSSSETSSSGSSHGYVVKTGVIAQALSAQYPQEYEPVRQAEQSYAMDCDRVSVSQMSSIEGETASDGVPLTVDGRAKLESTTLRAVRKPEHGDDCLHYYKFKNSIERRFSRSQDEAAIVPRPVHGHSKVYNHKRRRAAKPALSTSTSNSGSTEEARDTSPQDTSSESLHQHHYEKVQQSQFVPIFALNAVGKYYVPLSVDSACLSKHLGPYEVLGSRAAHLASPLHPVTIHVNFQPCINYHVKKECNDWRPA